MAWLVLEPASSSRVAALAPPRSHLAGSLPLSHQPQPQPSHRIHIHRMDFPGLWQFLAIDNLVAIPLPEPALHHLRSTPDQDDGTDAAKAIEHPIADVIGNPAGVALPVLIDQRQQVDLVPSGPKDVIPAGGPLPDDDIDIIHRQAAELIGLGFDGPQDRLAQMDIEARIFPGGVLQGFGVEVAIDEFERVQGIDADIK